jgi:DnaJ-class molecular chaperone
MSCMAPEAPPDYVYETCGLCNGEGTDALVLGVPCPTCKGTGNVIVHQPPIICYRCDGDGRAKRATDRLDYTSELCMICRGTGWALSKPL